MGSLFKKMFVIHISVLAAAVVLIAVMMSILYTSKAYEAKEQSLSSASTMVNAAMNEYYDGTLSAERLIATINMIGYIADARIYAIRYDQNSLETIAAEISGMPNNTALVSDMQSMIAGEKVFRSRLYSEQLDTDVVFAGVPMTHGTDIQGGILLFAPLDRINSDVWQINLTIAVIALVVMAIGTVVILQLTRRITHPIRQMQEAAVLLASGETTNPIPVITDDEIGRLARTFNHMQSQLQRTEHIRRGFIANVSHELRTPLTSIRGFLQGMLDGVITGDAVPEHLQRMMDEVMRLNKLTGEILDLAKLQSGTMTLLKERLDLRLLAMKAVSALEGYAMEKQISLSVESGSPMVVYADSDRIQQVLVNLLGNAIKFTPDNGTVQVLFHEGDTFEMIIRDTGIGIPEDELEMVFDKFHRVDKTGNPAYGGSGLGLNIAKTIVELHHGHIIARRAYPTGTEMIVSLPPP